jgi:hypothetical protein
LNREQIDETKVIVEQAISCGRAKCLPYRTKRATPDEMKAWFCDLVDSTIADGGSVNRVWGVMGDIESDTPVSLCITGNGPTSKKYAIAISHLVNNVGHFLEIANERLRLQELALSAWLQFSYVVPYKDKPGPDTTRDCGGMSVLEELEDYLQGAGLIDDWGNPKSEAEKLPFEPTDDKEADQ